MAEVAQLAVPRTHSLMSMLQSGPSYLRQALAGRDTAPQRKDAKGSICPAISCCCRGSLPSPPHPLSAQEPAAAGPFSLHPTAGPLYSCCNAAALLLIRPKVESVL